MRLEQRASSFLVSTLLVSHSTMANQTTAFGRAQMSITNTFHSSQMNAPFGHTVLDTVETHCSERNALLSALHLSLHATKAGLLSTCSSSSSPILTAKSNTLLAHSRQLAERQTLLCLSQHSQAGRSRLLATISHG